MFTEISFGMYKVTRTPTMYEIIRSPAMCHLLTTKSIKKEYIISNYVGSHTRSALVYIHNVPDPGIVIHNQTTRTLTLYVADVPVLTTDTLGAIMTYIERTHGVTSMPIGKAHVLESKINSIHHESLIYAIVGISMKEQIKLIRNCLIANSTLSSMSTYRDLTLPVRCKRHSCVHIKRYSYSFFTTHPHGNIYSLYVDGYCYGQFHLTYEMRRILRQAPCTYEHLNFSHMWSRAPEECIRYAFFAFDTQNIEGPILSALHTVYECLGTSTEEKETIVRNVIAVCIDRQNLLKITHRIDTLCLSQLLLTAITILSCSFGTPDASWALIFGASNAISHYALNNVLSPLGTTALLSIAPPLFNTCRWSSVPWLQKHITNMLLPRFTESNHLQCQVCMMTDSENPRMVPYLLPCGHWLCTACTNLTEQYPVLCLMCNMVFDTLESVAAPLTNIYTKRMTVT